MGEIVLVSSLQSAFVASEWDPFKDTLYLCQNNYISVISFTLQQEAVTTDYDPLEDP